MGTATPDGRFVLFARIVQTRGQRRAFVFARDTNDLAREVPCWSAQLDRAVLGPPLVTLDSGRCIVAEEGEASGPGYGLREYAVGTGQLLRSWQPKRPGFGRWLLSPDSCRLVVAQSGLLRAFALEEPEEEVAVVRNKGWKSAAGIAFHPSGRWLAAWHNGPTVNFRESVFAPTTGFRYDGLYAVESYWKEKGKSGFLVWRYRLVKCDDSPIPAAVAGKTVPTEPHRKTTTIQRIVRSTAVAQLVKELHKYRCQVCGIALETSSGPYAEAAHIRPLGRPHNGPDVAENVLCLCPNHHVLFDLGAFAVEDDFSLIGLPGKRRTIAAHKLSVEYLQYHRSLRPDAG
jgi:hypothetical protein